jgi:hypothetical protein
MTVLTSANKTIIAGDGAGNLIAGVIPASGVISSAMQGVASAGTLAAGRAAPRSRRHGDGRHRKIYTFEACNHVL